MRSHLPNESMLRGSTALGLLFLVWIWPLHGARGQPAQDAGGGEAAEKASGLDKGFDAIDEGVFFVGSARGQVDASTGDSGAAIGTGFELQHGRYFASFIVSAGSEQPSFNDQSDFGRFLLAPHLSPISGHLEVDVYPFPTSSDADHPFLGGLSAGLFVGRGEWETVLTPPTTDARPEVAPPLRAAADATAVLVTLGPVARWVVQAPEDGVGVDAWLFAGGGLRFLTVDLAPNARAIASDTDAAEDAFLEMALGEDNQTFGSLEIQAGADVEGIRILLEAVVCHGPEGLDGVHIMPTVGLKPGIELLSLEDD